MRLDNERDTYIRNERNMRAAHYGIGFKNGMHFMRIF